MSKEEMQDKLKELDFVETVENKGIFFACVDYSKLAEYIISLHTELLQEIRAYIKSHRRTSDKFKTDQCSILTKKVDEHFDKLIKERSK